ncbi:helix-turn-helix domain-containing protein [Flavobacterium gyeonganense]|uniref:Helix-turn-helix domain-containing protein n=1 Tax=Flavobacterium gyeonganense TaxID=1310418 RepID=A0ABV5HA04_9FLAO|nr:AraC family transcriptional regulator [Flavobacterium gyeonganense]
MNFYQQEIHRISKICYKNESQIKTVIRTKKFIETNFEQELNLDVLSDAQFTSKFHLLRLFKKYYGMTPIQYLIDRRIEKSKEYLQNGMPVTETCFAIGFESPSSFSTLFKNKIGIAPVEFQKRAIFAK